MIRDLHLSSPPHHPQSLTMKVALPLVLAAAAAVSATSIEYRTTSNGGDPLANCPGYKASNVKTGKSSLTADLKLAGKACNVYGDDLTSLTLEVEYQSGKWH